MTKLLDEAVGKVRELSEEDQDNAAAMLLGFADRGRQMRAYAGAGCGGGTGSPAN
jgi:hypothetical protein